MPARANLLFTFRLVPVVNAMLARAGIDGSELVAAAGLPAEAIHGEITAPIGRIQEFLDGAAAALELDLFGIELAAQVPGGAYGVSEFLVRSAPTVEHGLRVLCEFAALINPAGRFRYVELANRGELHYAIDGKRDTLGRHLNEFTIAYIVRQLRSVLDREMPLAQVWFSHARKTSRAGGITEHFGCDVRFGAADCGFALARGVLSMAPRSADPLLFEFLHAQARAHLARIGSADIVTHLVRVLEMRLASGELDTDSVARALATTSRSLQRHLAEAGTSYRDVLAHVRARRRAELASGGVDDHEIARQLGFSDARALRRSLGR